MIDNDVDVLDPLIPELREWRRLEVACLARECPTWLEDLAKEYPRLNALCAEYRKPMTARLELALDRAADRVRANRELT